MIQIQWKSLWVSFHCWLSYCYSVLHMSWEHNFVAITWSLDENKRRFSSKSNHDGQMVSEMGPNVIQVDCIVASMVKYTCICVWVWRVHRYCQVMIQSSTLWWSHIMILVLWWIKLEHLQHSTELILGLHQANGRTRYKVTLSLIGWAQT